MAPAATPAGAPMQMAPSVEPAAATPYLEVNGMVTPEVLMDDEEYREVSNSVRSILHINRIDPGLLFDSISIGSVRGAIE